MNSKYKKAELSEITLPLFKEVITECLKEGLSNFAPLGASGEHFLLFSQNHISDHDRQLTIRLHNSTPEMLLTDRAGRFIFYGKFHKILGVDFIAAEFYRLFKELERFLAADDND